MPRDLLLERQVNREPKDLIRYSRDEEYRKQLREGLVTDPAEFKRLETDVNKRITDVNKRISEKVNPLMKQGLIEGAKAFGQGVLPIDRTPDLPQKYPIEYGLGNLLGLVGAGAATGGVFPAVEKAAKVAPWLRFLLARSAQGGAAFGLKSASDEVAKRIGGDRMPLSESAKSIAADTAFGAGLGAIGSIGPAKFRIPAEAAYGFGTAKLAGAGNKEALGNAALFGAFGLMNRGNVLWQYQEAKMAAYRNSVKSLADRLVADGINPGKAQAFAEKFIKTQVVKAGGLDKLSLSEFNEVSNKIVKGGKIVVDEPIKPATETPGSSRTEGNSPISPTPNVPAVVEPRPFSGRFIRPESQMPIFQVPASKLVKGADRYALTAGMKSGFTPELKKKVEDIIVQGGGRILENGKTLSRVEPWGKILVNFDDPVTGSSLVIDLDKLTPEAINSKVIEKQKVFGKYKEPELAGMTKAQAIVPGGEDLSAKQVPVSLRPKFGKPTEPPYIPEGSEPPQEYKPNIDLIDKNVARIAHNGTSFSPEKRGEQEIADFGATLQNVYDSLKNNAKSEAGKKLLIQEMLGLEKSLAVKKNALLSRHSGLYSSMIAGPSNFPVARMQKKNDAYMKAVNEYLEFINRAKNAINKKLNELNVQEAGGETEIAKKQIQSLETAHAKMKEVNAIVRKNISDEEKIKLITPLIGEKNAVEILKPDFAGRKGFAQFELTSNLEKIKRLKEKIAMSDVKDARGNSEFKFEGGTIYRNSNIDRIQIFYDSKPSPEVISKLKSNGFHWSPSNKAWQRQWTPAAEQAVVRVTGYKAPQPQDQSNLTSQPKGGGQGNTTEAPQWKYEDYSDWSREIAKNYTKKEIEKKFGITEGARDRLAQSHLNAIEKTTSMNSNSQRRAQTRNSMVANYEENQALKNALEIYEYYPEHTKDGLTSQPKGGGIIHDLTPEELKQAQQINADGVKVVNLKRDLSVKDLFGNIKNYKAGHSIFIYQDPNTGMAIVKNGDWGVLSKKSVKLVQQAKQKGLEPMAGEEGVEEVVKQKKKAKELSVEEDSENFYYNVVDEKGKIIKRGLDEDEANEYVNSYNEKVDTTKFSQWTLPGGENYREVLFKGNNKIPENLSIKKRPAQNFYYVERKLPNGMTEVVQSGFDTEQDAKNWISGIEGFRSSHWEEPNVIAHTRLNDRTTPDGKKILFIEEIQSDWARKGREYGFRPAERKEVPAHRTAPKEDGYTIVDLNDNDLTPNSKFKTREEAEKEFDRFYNDPEFANKVPSHPLLKNWQEFTLKRIIQKAINEGYDGIAWTTGEQQAERYDLSKQVEQVQYDIEDKDLVVIPKGETTGKVIANNIELTDLDKYIGKDVAKKLQNQTGRFRILGGLDLKIGGEWAKNLYDRQIPNILKDLTGGGVGRITTKGKESQVLARFPNKELAELALKEKGQTTHQIRHYEGGAWELIKKDYLSDQPALLFTPEMKAKALGMEAIKGGGLPARQPEEIPEGVSKEEAQMQLELADVRNSPQGNLMKAIRQVIRPINITYMGMKGKTGGYIYVPEGYLSEEIQPLVRAGLITRNESRGMAIDKVINSLKEYGWEFDGDDAFIEAVKDAVINPIEKIDRKYYLDIIRQSENNEKAVLKFRDMIGKYVSLPQTKGKVKQTVHRATGLRPDFGKYVPETKAFTESMRAAQKASKQGFRAGFLEGREAKLFGNQRNRFTVEQKKDLLALAREKGLLYTDNKGTERNRLPGLLQYYNTASFDELKNYISALTGSPSNPPMFIKLYGDIKKDAEAMRLIAQESENWQDINKLEMYSLDPIRIAEKVTGKDAWENILFDNTVGAFSAANTAMESHIHQDNVLLENNKSGITKGSKESAETMRKFEAGEQLNDKEKKLVDWLRSRYDEIIQEANATLSKAGYPEIPYRKGYMPHIREVSLLQEFFKIDPDNAKVVDLSQLDAIRKGDYTKGNKPFNRFALQRQGQKTKYDAVGNYETYRNVLFKVIYYTPAIKHARAFADYALRRQPNAYKAIDRLLSEMKGKPSIGDESLIGAFLSWAPIKALRRRLAANALVANLNFWAVNASNIATASGEIGPYLLKGEQKFLMDKTWRRWVFEKSNMMKGRTFDPDIDPGAFQQLGQFLAHVNTLIEYNNVGGSFSGAYMYAIEKLGYDNPKAIKYADVIARRTQTGYKPYELPAYMRSNFGRVLSMFQSWAFNAMNHIIYDMKVGNVVNNTVQFGKRLFGGKPEYKPTRIGALLRLIVTLIIVDVIYDRLKIRRPYDIGSAIPRVPYISTSRYEEPPLFSVMSKFRSIGTAKTPKGRDEAIKKAAIKIGTSLILPYGGTQVSRFLEGKIFPDNSRKRRKTIYVNN